MSGAAVDSSLPSNVFIVVVFPGQLGLLNYVTTIARPSQVYVSLSFCLMDAVQGHQGASSAPGFCAGVTVVNLFCSLWAFRVLTANTRWDFSELKQKRFRRRTLQLIQLAGTWVIRPEGEQDPRGRSHRTPSPERARSTACPGPQTSLVKACTLLVS